MRQASTDETRAVLAELLGLPADNVLHYGIAVNVPGGGLVHQFCGMPADGIGLYAAAIQTLAAAQADIEAAKLAAGCTACRDPAPGT